MSNIHQLVYIARERGRYRRLDALREQYQGDAVMPRGHECAEYKDAAQALGLHAQQKGEIEERFTQLNRMKKKALK